MEDPEAAIARKENQVLDLKGDWVLVRVARVDRLMAESKDQNGGEEHVKYEEV